MFAKELTALSETFLDEKAHARYLCAGLPAEIDDGAGSVSIRQEIINEEDAVLVGQDSGLVVHASYSHVQNDRELVA